MTAKEWVFPKNEADGETVRRLCGAFGLPEAVARVMVNRGLDRVEDARRFLTKDTGCLHDPLAMADMDKAAARIRAAIENGEKITVYGDYDVDGITATALMVRYLRGRGAVADAYIPDRQTEGYGINRGALDKIAAGGTKLVVTVDTGITAVDEAEYAGELGLDMIITDHHECKETLPSAAAVVNPKRPDCPYPFKELAGVGVAFKLVCALDGGYGAVLESYGDIVALGTIADVVSLTDENRAIVDYGIKKMNTAPNPGLGAVMNIVSVSKWNSSAVVSYSVAPRLNAAGRMSSAMTGVELLLTEDAGKAGELALFLDEENRRRQQEESVIFAEAAEMINRQDCFGKKVIVLAKRGWHHGIIGVVASRICDKFNKTCILISVEDGRCKSSGRSVEGFNLFEALSRCGDILEKFGGHAYAAGFSIAEENIPELDRRLNEYADEIFEREPAPRLYIDAEIDISDLNLDTVRKTEVLCPYGAGNKTPVFALSEMRISDLRLLSGGRHCRLLCEKEGLRVEAIAFGMGGIANEYGIGDIVDLAGEMNINYYNGTERVQLVLADLRLSRRRPGDILPSRDDFADIYRYIKRRQGPIRAEAAVLANDVSLAMRRRIKREKLMGALSVFDDVGIIRLGVLGDMVKVELLPAEAGQKVNLDSSPEYIRIKKSLNL